MIGSSSSSSKAGVRNGVDEGQCDGCGCGGGSAKEEKDECYHLCNDD